MQPLRPDAGYIAMMLILGLAAGAVVAAAIAPNLVRKTQEQSRAREDARLAEIASGFVTSIRRTQCIPSLTNWAPCLSQFSDYNQTNALAVYPEFPADTTTRRIVVADPSLSGIAFPVGQGAGGLTGAATNLAGASARLLLISSTKRGLAPGITAGVAGSKTAFDSVWNWIYDPATKAPPTGWSSAWNKNADHLHVARIRLSPLVHQVVLRTVSYTVSGDALSVLTPITALLPDALTSGLLAPVTALSSTNLFLFDNTLLSVYRTNGELYQMMRLQGDARFDLNSTNVTPPNVWYRFSGSTAATAPLNSGSYGSKWDAQIGSGVALGKAGPLPPAYANYDTNNTAVFFDGSKNLIDGQNKLTNYLPGFTISAWIRPTALTGYVKHIAGMRQTAFLGIYSNSTSRMCYVRLGSKYGGTVSAIYPYKLDEWHHILGVADGAGSSVYIDGVLAKSRAKGVLNYYYASAYKFTIGGFNPANNRTWFVGGIDEVTFYDRALGTNEIARLATGLLP